MVNNSILNNKKNNDTHDIPASSSVILGTPGVMCRLANSNLSFCVASGRVEKRLSKTLEEEAATAAVALI